MTASRAGPSLAKTPEAVLFDLDGTLLDTAPDMVGSLNELRSEEGQPPLAYAEARDHVSNGALGLLRIAFPGFDPAHQPDLHRRFLDLYERRLCRQTCLFPELDGLLAHLEARSVPWGIVTNKPGYLTEPLLECLRLSARAACVVSGDTLPERKPHPRPIQHALELLDVAPGVAVYVGDAARDIASGRAAGTQTVAVRYGYIEPGQDPADWGADHVVGSPADLVRLVTETAMKVCR